MSPSTRLGTSRPTWAEIDLGAITYNYRAIKNRLTKGAGILAVVKANAYGYGMIPIARRLVKEGAAYLGVACVDEAVALREAKIKAPILILSSVLPDEIKVALRYDLTFTVADADLATRLDKTARAQNKKVFLHIKVDTGMGRLGVWHEEAEHLIDHILMLKNVVAEGIFTHFSSADAEETDYTAQQLNDFNKLISDETVNGLRPKYIHAANSAGAILYKDSHFNLVRPGLMLYGLYPNEAITKLLSLKPALSLKTKIIFLKPTPAGRGISYGRTHITERQTTIATLPIGYADGLNRHLSNKGYVLVHGRRCPIVGAICMDHTMVDIRGLRDVKIGDEVVLIGRQGKEEITVEEIARLLDTIPYEIVCWLSARVPRVYK